MQPFCTKLLELFGIFADIFSAENADVSKTSSSWDWASLENYFREKHEDPQVHTPLVRLPFSKGWCFSGCPGTWKSHGKLTDRNGHLNVKWGSSGRELKRQNHIRTAKSTWSIHHLAFGCTSRRDVSLSTAEAPCHHVSLRNREPLEIIKSCNGTQKPFPAKLYFLPHYNKHIWEEKEGEILIFP